MSLSYHTYNLVETFLGPKLLELLYVDCRYLMELSLTEKHRINCVIEKIESEKSKKGFNYYIIEHNTYYSMNLNEYDSDIFDYDLKEITTEMIIDEYSTYNRYGHNILYELGPNLKNLLNAEIYKKVKCYIDIHTLKSNGKYIIESDDEICKDVNDDWEDYDDNYYASLSLSENEEEDFIPLDLTDFGKQILAILANNKGTKQ